MTNSRIENADQSIFDELHLKKPVIGVRWILVLLCNLMFVLAAMESGTISITIIAMVNSTKSAENNQSSEWGVCRTANSSETSDSSNSAEFYWTPSQQGLVLGAYSWGFLMGRFFGGRLGEVNGQRSICGIGLTAGAIIVALCPIAADLNVYCFVAARFFLGIFHGPMLPAVYSLMCKWAPRSELATMLTTIISGLTIGGTIGLLTSSWIIDSIGWRWVFWSEALITFVWVPFWFFYVRNDPSEHPYVTPYEAKILEQNVAVVINKSVPWKQILLSPYVYICMFCDFAFNWSLTMQMTVGPSFFSKRIGLELSTISLVTGIARLLSLSTMIMYGRISDFLITGKYAQKLTIRKMMHGIGTCGPAIVYILLTFAGCSIPWSIALFQFIGVLSCATSSSIDISVIDFAPNYTGTIMGLTGIGNIGGSLAPIVASYLAITKNGWNKAFYVTASLSIISCIIYLLRMTDKPQSWNNYHQQQESNIEEESEKSPKNSKVDSNSQIDFEEF